MGKPLMIQPADEKAIEDLKVRTGARTKVDVVRAGLRLLERETERSERIKRWQKAVALALVSESSTEVNREFQRNSRLKRA